MNFKVGKRYKEKGTGNIIEVTGIETDIEMEEEAYYYKPINYVPSASMKFFYKASQFARRLEPINECIVIYANKNKVIAVNKSNGLTAKATCSPDDKFDFKTGAKLAFSRLMESEEIIPDCTKEVAKFFKDMQQAFENTGYTHEESMNISRSILLESLKGDKSNGR